MSDEFDPFNLQEKDTPDLSLEEVKKKSLILPVMLKPIITTKEELLVAIQDYFELCNSRGRYPTMTGLANSLGTTRHNLQTAIHDNAEFNEVLTIAKQTVIQNVEEELISPGGRASTGLIFWLKNNDEWIDKTEIVKGEKSMAEILKDLQKSGEVINGNNPLSFKEGATESIHDAPTQSI
jgi:hypothetical protein